MKGKKTHLQVVIYLIIYFFLSTYCFGEEITLIPFIEIQGQYNDNITFARTNKKEDYILNIMPGVTVEYDTELMQLETSGAIDVERFATETDLNTEKYEYDLNSAYQ